MSHRWIAWLLAACMAATAAACTRSDPEVRLRAALASMQAALVERDIDAIDSLLADDFIGPEAMDRDGARRLAQLSFLRYRDVAFRMGPPDITITGDRATVDFTVAMSGGSGALLPDSADIQQVRTAWRADGDDWKLLTAEWGEKSR